MLQTFDDQEVLQNRLLCGDTDENVVELQESDCALCHRPESDLRTSYLSATWVPCYVPSNISYPRSTDREPAQAPLLHLRVSYAAQACRGRCGMPMLSVGSHQLCITGTDGSCEDVPRIRRTMNISLITARNRLHRTIHLKTELGKHDRAGSNLGKADTFQGKRKSNGSTGN